MNIDVSSFNKLYSYSGLKIHPEKLRAVLEMPRPIDPKSLLLFNATV